MFGILTLPARLNLTDDLRFFNVNFLIFFFTSFFCFSKINTVGNSCTVSSPKSVTYACTRVQIVKFSKNRIEIIQTFLNRLPSNIGFAIFLGVILFGTENCFISCAFFLSSSSFIFFNLSIFFSSISLALSFLSSSLLLLSFSLLSYSSFCFLLFSISAFRAKSLSARNIAGYTTFCKKHLQMVFNFPC